jgi:hypothetical protein
MQKLCGQDAPPPQAVKTAPGGVPPPSPLQGLPNPHRRSGGTTSHRLSCWGGESHSLTLFASDSGAGHTPPPCAARVGGGTRSGFRLERQPPCWRGWGVSFSPTLLWGSTGSLTQASPLRWSGSRCRQEGLVRFRLTPLHRNGEGAGGEVPQKGSGKEGWGVWPRCFRCAPAQKGSASEGWGVGAGRLGGAASSRDLQSPGSVPDGLLDSHAKRPRRLTGVPAIQ